MAKDLVGIFALDPGTTSGFDYGLWPLNCGTKEAVNGYQGICDEIGGRIEDQAVRFAQMYAQFRERNSRDKSVRATYLVVESYTQRPTAHFVEAKSLDPLRVAYMTLGYLLAVDGRPTVVNWQMPSEAMTYATNGRLREWGAWVKGKEHGRDARRHALAFRHAIEPVGA